jgi:hypothetical protein
LGPTTQGIRGNVRFEGVWPDSILEVRVVVFETYPVESFLDLVGYSDTLRLGCDSCGYEVSLPPGEYAFVAAVCRARPMWDTTCVLGFYYDPGIPDIPQSVTVTSGTFREPIDIGVEFAGLCGRIRLIGNVARGRE